jgi:hypothetical protein
MPDGNTFGNIRRTYTLRGALRFVGLCAGYRRTVGRVSFTFADLPEPNEVTCATGRLTTRTYASRSFVMTFGQDVGQQARYIHKVFDELPAEEDGDWEWTRDVVYTTPGGRKQIELNVARSAGSVRKIRIQKVPTSGCDQAVESLWLPTSSNGDR